MTQRLRIDFVSDVACPWCAVGLSSLEIALKALPGDVEVEMHFQPFELNPAMAAEGEDAAQHLKNKYGMGDAQLLEARERIKSSGAAVGFAFAPARSRVWNTFAAHRLLHWAGTVGSSQQHALKRALLGAYHGQNQSPADTEVLVGAAASAGLDGQRARDIALGNEFTAEVRDAQAFWQRAGINSVPAVVVNREHLISGGQPPAVFEQAMRQVLAPKVAL